MMRKSPDPEPMSGDDLKQRWEDLAATLLGTEAGVARGRMMSADALTYGGKVFVFFSTKGGRAGLGARIGRDTDVASLGLADWQHLAPFKTRPPMKDWIVAGAADCARWRTVATTCLALAKRRYER